MKYSKVFDSHTDYQTYAQSNDFLRPNISCCKQEHDIHYTAFNMLTCIFDTNRLDGELLLYSDDSHFNSNTIEAIYVNGEKLDGVPQTYTYDSNISEYTVKYLFKNRNAIPAHFLYDVRGEAPYQVIIPDGITTIGNEAFGSNIDNTTIERIIIADSVTTIGDSVFFGCGYLKYIKLPKNLTVIPDHLLAWCHMVETIDFDFSQVTEIQNNAFAYGLNSGNHLVMDTLNLPNIQTIGQDAFRSSRFVKNIVLGPNLTSIGSYAFNNTDIKTITVQATTPPTCSSNPFPDRPDHIYVPASSVSAYQAASGWSSQASIIEAIPTT